MLQVWEVLLSREWRLALWVRTGESILGGKNPEKEQHVCRREEEEVS